MADSDVFGISLSGKQLTSSWIKSGKRCPAEPNFIPSESHFPAGIFGFEREHLSLEIDKYKLSHRDEVATNASYRVHILKNNICRELCVQADCPVAVAVPYEASAIFRYFLCSLKSRSPVSEWKWFPVDVPVAAILALMENRTIEQSGRVCILHGSAQAAECVSLRFEVALQVLHIQILAVKTFSETSAVNPSAIFASDGIITGFQYGDQLSEFARRYSNVDWTVCPEADISKGATLMCLLRNSIGEDLTIGEAEVRAVRIEHLNAYPVGVCGTGDDDKVYWRRLLEYGSPWSSKSGCTSILLGEMNSENVALCKHVMMAEFVAERPQQWVAIRDRNSGPDPVLRLMDVTEIKQPEVSPAQAEYRLEFCPRTEFELFGGGLRQFDVMLKLV